MDQVIFQAIKQDIVSPEMGRQTSAILVALQLAAGGKDISCLSSLFCSQLISNSTNPVTKQLAYDAIRSTYLTTDDWEVVCQGMANDFASQDPDVTAAALQFLTALPTWRIERFITEFSNELSQCLADSHAPLRRTAVDALGALLSRDDIVSMCARSPTLNTKLSSWWRKIGHSALDTSDEVSSAAFNALSLLFAEFSEHKVSRSTGHKVTAPEAGVSVWPEMVANMCAYIWSTRDVLISRAALLPLDLFRPSVHPLAFAARAIATGLVDDLKIIADPGRARRESNPEVDLVNAERTLGVSDIVTHLMPYLGCSDPALIYDVGLQLLALAGVPGGKPEWAAGPITAFLALWDRQEFSPGREAIVKTVVSHLQLLDLHMQVALFKRLLVMIRNLRMEADRMHAMACICRASLSLDLFMKESARRGQRPIPGTDVTSLFGDSRELKDEIAPVPASALVQGGPTTETGLFREELLACLIESCFQASVTVGGGKGFDLGAGAAATTAATAALGALAGTAGDLKHLGKVASSRVSGGLLASLAGQSSSGFASWALTALEVLEVCRPCLKWDCSGRSYALDCYLRLLVRLCHVYDTASGVKTLKQGATPEQVQAETRLQVLLAKLLEDLKDVRMPHIKVRLLWALSEHMHFSGPEPLFAEEPRDPLTMLVAAMHKMLFNPGEGDIPSTNPGAPLPKSDSEDGGNSRRGMLLRAAAAGHRLAEVHAILVCALHLGLRSFRAAALVSREVDQFRRSDIVDAVSKQQCSRILQALSYVQEFPDCKWAAWVSASGDYPFSHHNLTIQYKESVQAQDRKLEALVKRAVRELWDDSAGADSAPEGGPASAGQVAGTAAITPSVGSVIAAASMTPAASRSIPLSGSSDPVHLEASHVAEVTEQRITLNIKVLNMTEGPLERVDLQLGLSGSLRFLDGAPRAVRELRGLQPQEPVNADVTVWMSGFQRSKLQLFVVYHHTSINRSSARKAAAASTGGEEHRSSGGDEGEHHSSSRSFMGRRRGAGSHASNSDDSTRGGAARAFEPVRLRCLPYKLPLTGLLLPYRVSPVEFFRIVPSLPAAAEHTGAYLYETNERGSAIASADDVGYRRMIAGLKSLDSKPLYKVCSHLLRSRAGFQVCYLAKTWFGDTLSIIVFGSSDIASDGGFGQENTTMFCKFVIRSSSASVVEEILADPQEWLDDLTGGAIRAVTEEELEAYAAMKKKRHEEALELLKQSLKENTREGIRLPGMMEPEGSDAEVPVIPEEEQALQLAVLQEWNSLRAQQRVAPKG